MYYLHGVYYPVSRKSNHYPPSSTIIKHHVQAWATMIDHDHSLTDTNQNVCPWWPWFMIWYDWLIIIIIHCSISFTIVNHSKSWSKMANGEASLFPTWVSAHASPVASCFSVASFGCRSSWNSGECHTMRWVNHHAATWTWSGWSMLISKLVNGWWLMIMLVDG